MTTARSPFVFLDGAIALERDLAARRQQQIRFFKLGEIVCFSAGAGLVVMAAVMAVLL